MVKFLYKLGEYTIFLYYWEDEILSNGKNYVYEINCIFKEKHFTYKFTDSMYNYQQEEKLGEEGLYDSFECYISDAIAGSLDLIEFIEEFGYTNIREASTIHSKCVEMYTQLQKICDLEELENVRSLI